MNEKDFSDHLAYLKKQALDTKDWMSADCQVTDEFDTYPIDLFVAAATPEFILEMIKRLETK